MIILGILVISPPVFWGVPGSYLLTWIVCYLWHGQIIYWFVASNGNWGLVFIAYDRSETSHF